jgi:2,3-dimethylmalate lyase
MGLRDRLESGSIVVALGAHDPLSALIAQHAGIEVVYQGGYSLAAHHHGLPDIGLIGLPDVLETLRRIRAVSSVPVVVDADTGYGAEAAVRRVVIQLEEAGAAAIQIEDQVWPKRCGHMEGKRVIPREEMVTKVRAAIGARANPQTVIIARTDALAIEGLDAVLDRCNAYAEAGADLVFVDAPRSTEELRMLAERVNAPMMANMTETGRTPLLSAAELEQLGYRMVIFPSTQTWLFAKAYRELCEEVVKRGTTREIRERFMSFDDINALLGRDRWEQAPAEGRWRPPGRSGA